MNIIRVESLTKRLGHFKLGPLNLQLAPGEILGILGPKGSGKTTLLQVLWGFARPDSGKVVVFELAPHLHQLSIRLRAGYLSQAPKFHEWMTARQFLQFVAGFYDNWNQAHADSLLDRFNIDGNHLIRKLSKGNRVKLALVAALGHRPMLLLLDEPTRELDSMMRLDVLKLIRKLAVNDGTAIVVASDDSDDLDHIPQRMMKLPAEELSRL